MEEPRPKHEKPKSATESLNAPINIPTGFSKDAKHQTAESVLQQTRNSLDRWTLERRLYIYLTQRVSDPELASIEESFNKIGAEEKYYATLRKVAQEAAAQGLKVNNDVAWFSLYRQNPSLRKKERMGRTLDGKTDFVEISYKEYFTVPIKSKEAQGALAEIESLQNVLPVLAKELADLGQSENEEIKMKIPGNLQSLIKHPDSLVIHYRNAALSEKIRQIVDKNLGNVGLETRREGRVASGFDLSSENELYDGSHSSLMSSIVADRIINAVKANPQLIQASTDEFIQFLDRAFGEYDKLSPKELLERLDKIKN